MSAEQQVNVEQAFAAVVAAREGSTRTAVETTELLGLCGGDTDVRREVQSLLEHLDDSFLNPEELHGTSNALSVIGNDSLLREWGGEAVGQRVDGFTIIGKLSEGGMGVVY